MLCENVNFKKNSHSILHRHCLNALFSHKKEISIKFSDIIGLHYIEHIAIYILNPANELLIFSQTPSVEFNLIDSMLWKYDESFHSKSLNHGYSGIWRDLYCKKYSNLLIPLKETKHGFTYSMNLCRKIDEYSLLYSLATRSNFRDISLYYKDLKNELFDIGDYAYNAIKHIYSAYTDFLNTPTLHRKFHIGNKVPHLKLIINNEPSHSKY